MRGPLRRPALTLALFCIGATTVGSAVLDEGIAPREGEDPGSPTPSPAAPAGVRAAAEAVEPAGAAVAVDPAALGQRLVARVDAALAEAPPVYVGGDGEVVSVARIRRYLERNDSPLAPYARTIVDAGVRADVDPRLVVGIAAAESSLGKRQLGHNAWGWGASTVAAMERWPDWETAVREYTAALGRRYDTDHVDAAFAQRYVPPNWRWWLSTVRSVMAEI